jgi:branched-chain amino acid aminotransferase
MVRDGVLLTPRERYVLPGISRQTVIDLARAEGVPFEETDFDLFDAYNGEEFFITSTSFCICPVRSINGSLFGDGSVPGPITDRLMKAYVDHVGFDWIAQYMRYPVTATPRV